MTDQKSLPVDLVPPVSKEVTIKADDLLSYIEIDLWSRFQARLWKVVAAFLTVVTIAGLLGVPYYIKSEIANRLQTQAKTYADRIDEIAAFSKLLATLSAEYEARLFSLRADAEMMIGELRRMSADQNAGQAQDKVPGPIHRSAFNDPAELINQLISDPDIPSVVDSQARGGVFSRLSDEQRKTMIGLRKMYMRENRGFTGWGAYGEAHPVLDGTLGGFLDDVKYGIIILSALKEAMAHVHGELIRLGGTSDLEKRLAEVKVTAIATQVFLPKFKSSLNGATNKEFLSQTQKTDFKKYELMYIPSFAQALSKQASGAVQK